MNTNQYHYWGKNRVSSHLLVYHCLDVAALGQLLLLQDDYLLDSLTRNTTFDKDITLSLVPFCLTMHDLGKFSGRFQSRQPDFVKNLPGQISDPLNTISHAELSFYLTQKIWLKLWQENWLKIEHEVDKSACFDVLKPWFQSATLQHHGKSPNIIPVNMETHFTNDNIAAAYSFMKEVAEIFLDVKCKTFLFNLHESMHDTFKDSSVLLAQLTRWSDGICSNYEYFLFCSEPMPIKNYWDEFALPQAEFVVKEAGDLPEFYQKDDEMDLIRKAKYLKDNRKYIEAIECYEKVLSINPKNKKAKYLLRKLKKQHYHLRHVRIDNTFPPLDKKGEASSDKSNIYNVHDIRKKYPRAYEPWTEEEDEKLIFEYKSGKTIEELIELLGRQRGGIKSRLEKLDIISTSDKPINKGKISEEDLNESFDQSLFEKLRILRKKLADMEGIPPFCIFYDLSLEAMATNFPKDLQSLRNIEGVDGKNLKKYGELFIKEIVEYCEQLGA